MTKPKVAFICVHNSCRSQIAEALGKAAMWDVLLLVDHLMITGDWKTRLEKMMLRLRM